MPIKIVGGSSSYRQIRIISDEFIATAKSDDNNKITCEVTRHSSLYQKLSKTKLPIPKLVRLILFLFVGMKKSGWWLFGVCIIGFILKLVYHWDEAIPVQSESIWTYLASSSPFIFLVYMLYDIRSNIASWHGAEHMVIASYCRLNSYNIRDIARESTINDKCGGRFFFPILVIMAVIYLLAMKLGEESYFFVFLQLIAIECMFWVDDLVGLDKIRLTRMVSRLFQKYFTTKIPGQQELLTAQRAIMELVAAHNKTA